MIIHYSHRSSCIDPSAGCNCDAVANRPADIWLQDGGTITDKSRLPVTALHFGDTGTPFDTKEGRFTLGPLQCYDVMSGGDVTAANIYELNTEQTVAPLAAEMSELYFEIRMAGGAACGARPMEIVTLQPDGPAAVAGNGEPSSIRVIMTAKGRLEVNGVATIVNLSSGGLCDGRWHRVVVERSHLGASLAVDGVPADQPFPSLLPPSLMVQFGGQVNSL
jgi:hypothetical protein